MLQLITVKCAAAILDVHEDTVRRLQTSGVLTKHVIGARTVRVDQGELESYVHRGQRAPEAKAISDGQIAAFHAKAADLARLLGISKDEVKAATIEHAHRELGLEFTSLRQLSFSQASNLLDLLESQIEEAKA